MLAAFKALTIGGKLLTVLAILGTLAGLVVAFNVWKDGIREEGRDEVRAEWKAAREERAAVMAQFNTGLSAALRPIEERLTATIGNIDRQGAEINVRLPQAIAADPRYRDVNCSLTPDVLSQVNAARSLTAPVGEIAR